MLAVALYLDRTANVWLVTGVAAVLTFALLRLAAREWLVAQVTTVPKGRLVAQGIAVGLAMVLFTHLGYPLVRSVLPGVAAPVQALYGILDDWPGPVAALPVLVLVVFAEELVFRGLAFSLLEQRAGRGAAIVLATLLYTLPQLANPVHFTVWVALACGLLWTAQRALSHSMVPSFCCHLTWNLGVMVLYPVT